MDNRDFWLYIRATRLPEFDPSYVSSAFSRSSLSRPPTIFSWLVEKFHLLYRFWYARLHDLILSSLFGYLTLNEKLYVAVHNNNVHNARKLLLHGASPSFLPTPCETMIKHVVKNSTCSDRSLLSAIHASDSMLYIAVSNNSFELVQELIRYYDYGRAGLHTEVVSLCLAVKRGYFNIAQYLIDRGHINPNDVVQPGCKHCKSHSSDIKHFQFPLYHACRENRFTIVKYLLESKECNINQLTMSYETALHGAILGAVENHFDSSSNNQQRYEIVLYLLRRPDCNPNLGLNPLCASLAYDNIYEYTDLLLQYNCDVNRLGLNLYEKTKPNTRKNSYSSCTIDHPLNICLRLLSQINRSSSIADHSSLKQSAFKLINTNPDIYAMKDYGLAYPFLLAIETNDKVIVGEILNKAKLQINFDIIEPLISASVKLFADIVEMLIDFGFNPNTQMINGADAIPRLDTVSFQVDLSECSNHFNQSLVCSSESLMPTRPLFSLTQNDRCFSYINLDRPVTPLLALSSMPIWLFHPNNYESAMKTIKNLFSRTPVNFSILPNQHAFHYALLNEHMPIVYFCLQNYCPINLLDNTIQFTNFSSSKNYFYHTLFHLISVCCRLSSNDTIKRVLLNSYARTMPRVYNYDNALSMASVLAYMKLWCDDQDFILDDILFEHLMSLPYVDNIMVSFNEKKLRHAFGAYYDYMMERKFHCRSTQSLKHICRLTIRRHSQRHCEQRQANLLKVMWALNVLPKSLQFYLFYTRNKSNSLINHLLDDKAWDAIEWI